MANPPISTIPDLAQRIVDVVRSMITEIRPALIDAALSGDRGENLNIRHADNFLSVHDLWMHERYRERLRDRIGSFVYASEEADPQVVGDDPQPDLCILVDPLDTSELAVRGLHGYTHVLAYSRGRARPVAAVVGDIFHHVQLYVAGLDTTGQDHAYAVTADGDVRELHARPSGPVETSLITNYMMRPAERFLPLAHQESLLDELGRPAADGKYRGRIGVDFGSVGLCHVAAGFTDAMIEFAKGFAIWDLAPGQYILRAAGGVTVGLDAAELPLGLPFDSLESIKVAMSGRQKFVAARSESLARHIAQLLEPPTRLASGMLAATSGRSTHARAT